MRRGGRRGGGGNGRGKVESGKSVHENVIVSIYKILVTARFSVVTRVASHPSNCARGAADAHV